MDNQVHANIRKVLLPTPEEMVAHLDTVVQGQEVAKRVLSRAVYFHYLNLALGQKGISNGDREHCLVIGPTGSGKTLMVKSLCELLSVPMLYVNTATLTSEGYIGESFGEVLIRFAKKCRTTLRMERGIIFLDEIDKIRGNSVDADVRGVMVQQELLSALDGNILKQTPRRSDECYTVDTSKILFIGCGAFSGIESIVDTRFGRLGFSRNFDSKPDDEFVNRLVLPEDLVKYGFIPEFVARFHNIVPFQALSEEQLVSILRDKAQSPLTYYSRIYELHNIELTFTDGAVREIARIALARKQGARGLRSIISHALAPTASRVVELQISGVVGLVIDEGVIRQQSDGHLLTGSKNIVALADELRESVFEDGFFDTLKKGTEPELLTVISPLTSDINATEGEKKVSIIDGTDGSASTSSSTSIATSKIKNDEEYEIEIANLKELLKFGDENGLQVKWWEQFELENSTKKNLVVQVLKDLLKRKATIGEFFQAYVYSHSDSIQACLHFLDYRREKDKHDKRIAAESKQKENKSPEPEENKSKHSVIQPRLEDLCRENRDKLGYQVASENERGWWDRLEYDCSRDLEKFLQFGDELANRKLGISDIFSKAIYTPTRNLKAYLHLFDFHRFATQHSEINESLDRHIQKREVVDECDENSSKVVARDEIHPVDRTSLDAGSSDLGSDCLSLWSMIEEDFRENKSALEFAVLTLRSIGITGVEKLLEVCVRCGSYTLSAVVEYVKYHRLLAKEMLSRVPEYISPFWEDITLSIHKTIKKTDKCDSTLLAKSSFLSEISHDFFFEFFAQKLKDEAKLERLWIERPLSDSFAGKSTRTIRGISTAGRHWKDEVVEWRTAIEFLPVLHREGLLFSLIEGVVAELSPSLMADPSWLNREGLKDLTEKFSRASSFLVHEEEIAALLIYYTGDSLKKLWNALVIGLSDQDQNLIDTWLHFESGDRTLRRF